MNTIIYELKSIPVSVYVPENCGKYAENIVKTILNNNPERALEDIKQNYSKFKGILLRTEKLIQNPDSVIDQDKLYVLICLECNRKNLMNANSKPEEEVEKAGQMDIVLYDLFNDLCYMSRS